MGSQVGVAGSCCTVGAAEEFEERSELRLELVKSQVGVAGSCCTVAAAEEFEERSELRLELVGSQVGVAAAEEFEEQASVADSCCLTAVVIAIE